MAGSVNKVILVGHLGGDPEVRYTAGGQAVANFNLATSENWNDKQGQKQERTEWHRIVVWGKLAELCGEYLSKGRLVFVEGGLQTRTWDDKEGKKRYTTEIVAREVKFLGPRSEGRAPEASKEASKERASAPAAKSDAAEGFDFGPPPMQDDDIPF